MTVRPLDEQACNWDDSIFFPPEADQPLAEGPQSGVEQPPTCTSATGDVFIDDGDPDLFLSYLLMGMTSGGTKGGPSAGNKFEGIGKVKLLEVTANMFCLGSDRLVAATGMSAQELGRSFLDGRYPEFFGGIANYAEGLRAGLEVEILDQGRGPTEEYMDLVSHLDNFRIVVDRTPWLREGLKGYLDVNRFYDQVGQIFNENAAMFLASSNAADVEKWLTELKNNAGNPGKLGGLLAQTDEISERFEREQAVLRNAEPIIMNGFIDEKHKAEYRLRREIFHYLSNKITIPQRVRRGSVPVDRLKEYGPPSIGTLSRTMGNSWMMTDEARIYLEKEAPAKVFPILINMVDNASRAHVPGKRFQGEMGLILEGDRVILFVKDNGSGIPKEIRGKLFAEYGPQVHADKTMSGSGEGLYNAVQIINGMGGRIYFRTQTAEEAAATGTNGESYTTFYIELPHGEPVRPKPIFREFLIGPDGLPIGKIRPVHVSEMAFPPPAAEELIDTRKMEELPSSARKMALDEIKSAGEKNGGRRSEAAEALGYDREVRPEEKAAREEGARISEEVKNGVIREEARIERERKKK